MNAIRRPSTLLFFTLFYVVCAERLSKYGWREVGFRSVSWARCERCLLLMAASILEISLVAKLSIYESVPIGAAVQNYYAAPRERFVLSHFEIHTF